MDDLMGIGDVARLLGVAPSLIRKWERLGVIEPQMKGAGRRVYRVDDLNRLRAFRAAQLRRRQEVKEGRDAHRS